MFRLAYLFFDVMYCTPFVDLQSQTLFGVQSGRIGAEEVINDTDGKEEVAKTQAILLEMVGNLPDAEVKPPENVLFVCKLNPMTIEEDLEIIFSRFGLSCEIIRDLKSGESLCYAFIEFEKNMFGEGDCEKAFFKMDNVLIDDRLVHVDFSQSVSKIKWKGKGGKYMKDDFKDKVKPKPEFLSNHSQISFSPMLYLQWDREEPRWEKKTDWQHSHSRERDDGDDHHKHSMSHEKHRPEGLDKGHRESSRSHSPKKSKDKERSRHR
uniref:peptidylprolyl isomerase n=1 Tax=Oncorhynchus tshawytscha TaxID=74940 RepID=A0AAZ3NM03_ONCTS